MDNNDNLRRNAYFMKWFTKNYFTAKETSLSIRITKDKYAKIIHLHTMVTRILPSIVAGIWVGLIMVLLHDLLYFRIFIGFLIGYFMANIARSNLLCIEEELKKAYQSFVDLHIWREGFAIGIHGGGSTYAIAKTPLSILYLLFIKKYLSNNN